MPYEVGRITAFVSGRFDVMRTCTRPDMSKLAKE